MARKATVKEPTVKKPASSYILFTQSLRQKLKDEGKTIPDIRDFTKMAGEKWRAMSDSEKKPYQDQAQAAKDKFKKDVADGKIVIPKREKKTKGGKKKIVDPNAPKKGKKAFFLFVEDYRKNLIAQGITGGRLPFKQASEKWAVMTVDEKKKYNDMADEDKERYVRQMKSYTGPASSSKVDPVAKGKKKPQAAVAASSDEDGDENDLASEEDVDEDENASDDVGESGDESENDEE